jgi:dephospho-CoA kinase
MIIIGVTGTNGSGKGELAAYLKTQGFTLYSVRDFLVEEIKRRGLTVERPSMKSVADDLRTQFGAGYILETLYTRAAASGQNSVLESVRAMGEVGFLKQQKDFLLVAVDADLEIRYKRAVLRKSATDDVTFEKFVAQQEAEMKSDDPARMSISDCITAADVVLMNSGSMDEFHAQIDEKLGKYLKK